MAVELWKNELLPGITLADSSYSDHEFQPHFHDHYVIMIVNEGVNEGTCEKRRFQVTTSDVLFINPGEIHTGNSWQSRHLRYSAYYVTPEYFTKHLRIDLPLFTTLRDKNVGLSNRLKYLLHASRSKAPLLEVEESKVGAFTELLAYAGARKGDAAVTISRPSVERIKNYIKERYNSQFTLASLADHAGLSQYHLIRSFKNAVGITPFQYLRNFRIERAKHELLKNKPITEVALDVGFYDQSHFHKHFKLVTGVTPREFQRQ